MIKIVFRESNFVRYMLIQIKIVIRIAGHNGTVAFSSRQNATEPIFNVDTIIK